MRHGFDFEYSIFLLPVYVTPAFLEQKGLRPQPALLVSFCQNQ